jgi:hypothetical protein
MNLASVGVGLDEKEGLKCKFAPTDKMSNIAVGVDRSQE